MSRRSSTDGPKFQPRVELRLEMRRQRLLAFRGVLAVLAFLVIAPLVAPILQAYLGEWHDRLSSVEPETSLQPAPGNWRQQAKLAEDGWFGYSVALSGSTFVSGAKLDGTKGPGAGAAYVYALHGAAWVPQAQLLPEQGAPEDEFGHSVAIDAGTIVVGAYGDDTGAPEMGAAYIFDNSSGSWQQQAKLLPEGGQPGDSFGYSVAIDGDMVVVGAPGDNEQAADAGTAYVFRYDGASWIQEAKLRAGGGASHDRFGRSVAVAGDRVVVGAHEADGAGSASGAVYVFVLENGVWQEQALLAGSDIGSASYFGESVAISGDTLLAGAPGESGAGAAYLFTYDGASWQQASRLVGNDTAPGDGFGQSVALGSGTALVGAPSHDKAATEAGAGYIFTGSGSNWMQEQKVVAGDATPHAGYGFSAALDGGVVVLGIRGRNAVYLLEKQ